MGRFRHDMWSRLQKRLDCFAVYNFPAKLVSFFDNSTLEQVTRYVQRETLTKDDLAMTVEVLSSITPEDYLIKIVRHTRKRATLARSKEGSPLRTFDVQRTFYSNLHLLFV